MDGFRQSPPGSVPSGEPRFPTPLLVIGPLWRPSRPGREARPSQGRATPGSIRSHPEDGPCPGGLEAHPDRPPVKERRRGWCPAPPSQGSQSPNADHGRLRCGRVTAAARWPARDGDGEHGVPGYYIPGYTIPPGTGGTYPGTLILPHRPCRCSPGSSCPVLLTPGIEAGGSSEGCPVTGTSRNRSPVPMPVDTAAPSRGLIPHSRMSAGMWD